MRLTLFTAPLEEPVTLAEARAQLREPPTDLDAQILAQIFAGREHAEGFTGRALITQVWDLVLERFPCSSEIALPKPPLQEVVHVKYRDRANVEQTLATSAYQVDTHDSSPRIVLATNESWPDTYERIDAVTVRFKAGYGGTAKVPYQIQAAILLHVEAHIDRDERQMEKLLDARDSLLWPQRVLRL